MPRTIVAGNWKMHKTIGEAEAFAERFIPLLPSLSGSVDIVVCPPFTSLQRMCEQFHATRVKVGAQNMFWEQSGAFTGEVSPAMLVDLGVKYVILGHSERREYFGETDEGVQKKIVAALTHGLTPIVAVGETLSEHDAGKTLDRVRSQVYGALRGIGRDGMQKIVMAYEPVWAIGTGRNCDAKEANGVMQAIRECDSGLLDVPILYGGSVKAGNMAEYMAQPSINGGLVGGASLDPEAFAAIVQAAGNSEQVKA
ncbi:MAG: triose-phosphate isomerase [Candidatus Eremiobacteraeota bacterium]|nr:triose-phosphate isomerase [Candidatus Eremiobacteraeota bacterium]